MQYKMEIKNIQYYLYEDQLNTEGTVIVEESKLLNQLQEAIFCRKNDYSEDELMAAVGMMLMHYQAVTEPELVHKTKIQLESQHSKIDKTNQLVVTPIIQQIHNRRKSNFSTSSLLASCRNILKDFLSQNSW